MLLLLLQGGRFRYSRLLPGKLALRQMPLLKRCFCLQVARWLQVKLHQHSPRSARLGWLRQDENCKGQGCCIQRRNYLPPIRTLPRHTQSLTALVQQPVSLFSVTRRELGFHLQRTPPLLLSCPAGHKTQDRPLRQGEMRKEKHETQAKKSPPSTNSSIIGMVKIQTLTHFHWWWWPRPVEGVI